MSLKEIDKTERNAGAAGKKPNAIARFAAKVILPLALASSGMACGKGNMNARCDESVRRFCFQSGWPSYVAPADDEPQKARKDADREQHDAD